MTIMTAKQKLLFGVLGGGLSFFIIVLTVMQYAGTKIQKKQSSAAQTIIDKYFSASADELAGEQKQLDQAVENAADQWVTDNAASLTTQFNQAADNPAALEKLTQATVERFSDEVENSPTVKPLREQNENLLDQIDQDYTALVLPTLIEKAALAFKKPLQVTADEDPPSGGDEDEADHEAESVAKAILDMFIASILGGGHHDEQALPPDHDGVIEPPASGSKSWRHDVHEGHLEITLSFQKSFGRHVSLSLDTTISPDERQATHKAIAHARVLKRKDKFEMKVFIGSELKYHGKGEFKSRGPVFGVGGIIHL